MSKKISLGQIRKNTGIFKAGSFKERKGWEKEENGGGRFKCLLPEASLRKETLLKQTSKESKKCCISLSPFY